MNGFASLHPFAAGTVRRREARVAAVCGFLPRQRVCVRRNGKSQRCANVQATPKSAGSKRRESPPRREKSSRSGGASIAFG